MPPPPTPAIPRAAMSVPMDGAIPHPIVPSVKREVASRHEALRPMMLQSRPYCRQMTGSQSRATLEDELVRLTSGVKQQTESRYAPPSQDDRCAASKSDPIALTRVATIVVSREPRNT